MTRMTRLTCLLSAICFFGACAAQDNESPGTQLNKQFVKKGHAMPVQAEKLYAGLQCNISPVASATWISSPQQLQTMLQRTRSHIVDANKTAPTLDVDFAKDAVVAVSMGQQRTGGYALELSNSPLSINNATATLKLVWRTPGKGMIAVQMLTSPCLFVKLPKNGYRRLRVITLTGKEIASIDVH